MAKTKDITGQKFGKLTAIKFHHSNKNGYYWLFKCDCGTEKVILKNHVVRGKISSCGCNIGKYFSKDITGMKFGRLTALKKDHVNEKGAHYWECLCDCGNIKVVAKGHLLSGKIKSCGCLAKENHVGTHFESKTRLYKCWRSMKERCILPSVERYKNYGGRGIKICEPWYNYINFRNWAIKNGYKDYLTLDRIDVNGNYEPSNCRWSTILEQANNKTNNHYLEYCGEKLSIADLSRELNYPYKKLLYKTHKYNDDMDKIMEDIKHELSQN